MKKQIDLQLDTHLMADYNSQSQQIRVMTEDWFSRNGYCPNCYQDNLQQFENNRPVADFYCSTCREEFELKSKRVAFSQIINDGAYATMMKRLKEESHPSFFFLNYSNDFTVTNLLLIPKQFVTPAIIRKRRPLKPTARRSGWVGCNIDISTVPRQGKIFLIRDGEMVNREVVRTTFQQTLCLREQSKETRGWTLEVLACIEQLPTEFSLTDVYRFESHLQMLYPANHTIRAKIRQQLQWLRDKGLLHFTSRGRYRKLIE